jgi:hypothetical protein
MIPVHNGGKSIFILDEVVSSRALSSSSQKYENGFKVRGGSGPIK